ncbi:MAG TPA: type II toxin-antitoxin system VapC family toxin [Nitrospirae bacterium]|nr:type II toxin-antitoxin system VapC family toxin [Nitrospirota bacterium]HDZ01083.1 type II toxin-antitoxin system VapC family toxin [Nitrospirota bacterium]
MVLVDTSVWISHFRKNSSQLKQLLMNESVACHPFIIGELACGNIKNRKEIISLLYALPQTLVAGHDEILAFIENKKLMGIGIGLIDVHLLASALLSNFPLWTTDKRLRTTASKFNILYK